ncbi:hypothetical protein A0H81_10725 [Grifola frondosa]|uniref:Uncharacterized protein n=1 Tax=Grifola frondosa TaxID=5627 RepID=A0A1C7LX74_GRIFR|nr:hypothetical protein A0H81_10725 [Grifola frondosa]
MKDQAKRDYENFFLGQPYRLSDFDARYLLTQQQYTLTEKLAEVSFGNMYRDEAVRFAEMAERSSKHPQYLPKRPTGIGATLNSGHHDFLRREHDADLLQSITKKDVISLFLGRVHPSHLIISTRAKCPFIFHLQSQKARPPKISIAAMGAFEAAALRRGAVVDQQKWREELAAEGEPLLAQFIKFWQDMFAQEGSLVSPEVAEELFKTIPTITEEHPAVSDCDGKLNDGVVLIQDPKAFRASLRISEDPRPVVQWGDLPTSKF